LIVPITRNILSLLVERKEKMLILCTVSQKDVKEMLGRFDEKSNVDAENVYPNFIKY
jgi:hypothetical protein